MVIRKKAQLVDIMDHPVVEAWIINHINVNPIGLARLIGDNEERFKDIYGKPKIIDDKGISYWSVQWKGLNLILASSNTIGTVIKASVIAEDIFIQDQKIGGALINFCLYLIQNLSGEQRINLEE